jgi:hypothetical protein
VKLKQWALNLGIIVGSLWVGIVIGEIALRIAGIADPPPPDPELETLTYTVKDQYRVGHQNPMLSPFGPERE